MAEPAATLYVELRGRIERLEQDMSRANARLRRTRQQFNQTGKVLGRALGVGFGTVTAAAMGAALNQALKRGQVFNGVKQGFDTLQTAANQLADQSLSKLRTATKGMVSDFELMQNANQAVQLGLDASKLDVMAEAATKLGAAVGRDAADSFGDLITGVGRASPLILDNLGITVKAAEAQERHAATLGKTVKQLTELEKAEAFRAVALEKIQEKAKQLADIQLDAAQSADVLRASAANAFDSFSSGVTQSDDLAESLRKIADQISSVDWVAFGKWVGDIASKMLTLAQATAQVAGWFVDLGNAVINLNPGLASMRDYMLSGLDAAEKSTERMRNFREVLQEISGELGTEAGVQRGLQNMAKLGEIVEQQFRETAKEALAAAKGMSNFALGLASLGIAFTDEQAKVRDLLPKLDELMAAKSEVAKRTFNLEQALKSFNKENEKTGGGVDKTADKVKKLADEWDRLREQAALGYVQDQVQDAIDSLDNADFTKWRNTLSDVTRESVMESLQEGIAAGVIDPKHAEAYADLMVKNAIEPINEQWVQSQEEAHQKSVDTWRGLFQNAITGVTFDLEDALKQVAVGFAAEIAANIAGLGNLNISSPQDLGGALASGFFGNRKGDQAAARGQADILDGINSLGETLDKTIFDEGFWLGQTRPEGVSGPLLESGNFEPGVLTDFGNTKVGQAADQAGAALAIAQSVKAIEQLGDSTESTVQGVATLAGAAIGAYFGGGAGAAAGAQVGNLIGVYANKWFGLGGPSHPETLSRMDIAEALSKESGYEISARDTDRFNIPDWVGTAVNDYGLKRTGQYHNIFDFLAEAVNGDPEGIGQQVGQLALDQYAGNIEVLRGVVQGFGATLEQFTEHMIQLGKKGEKTWLDVVSSIRDGSEIFQNGIEGTGMVVEGALQIFESGGRGQQALNAVKNLFNEAAEAGINSAAGLMDFLQNSGQFSEAELTAIAEAMSQLGDELFSTFENASDYDLGRFVAAVDASLQNAGESFRENGLQIAAYQEQLEELDNKEIDVTVTTTYNTVGERPPELDGEIALPDTTTENVGVNTGNARSLSRREATNINIDARGAEAGVEQRLRSALIDLEDRVVNRTIGTIMESSRRGGRIGDSL